MFKLTNLFGSKEEKTVSDIIFDIMYFKHQTEDIIKKCTTKKDYINKILVPFNYMMLPITLGAKTYTSKKHGTILLFNEYSLSEKEIQQLAFLADEMHNVTEQFYKSIDQDNSDDIENLPEKPDDTDISISNIPVKEISKSVLSPNGLITKSLTGIDITNIAKDGKAIAKAIMKKNYYVIGGTLATLLTMGAISGFLTYKHRDKNESTPEAITDGEESENVIDVEVEPTDEIPYVPLPDENN